MRYLLFIAAFMLVFAIFDWTEIDTSSAYPTSPAERCYQAYEGTPNVAQCRYL